MLIRGVVCPEHQVDRQVLVESGSGSLAFHDAINDEYTEVKYRYRYRRG